MNKSKKIVYIIIFIICIIASIMIPITKKAYSIGYDKGVRDAIEDVRIHAKEWLEENYPDYKSEEKEDISTYI